MPFDVDEFIQCVQINNAVWEIGAKDYMDRNMKQKAWLTIGSSMYDNWNDLINDEKEERVKDLKNTWRHIRDNYSKYINQGKSGDDGRKRKKYVYADALTFLQHTVQKRKTSGNIAEPNTLVQNQQDNYYGDIALENIVDDNEINTSNSIPVSQSHLSFPNSNISSILSTEQPLSLSNTSTVKTTRLQNKKLQNEQTPFQTKLLDLLKNPQQEHTDPDKILLLSFLPYLQELTKDQKIDFQFQVLKFFKDIRQNSQTMNFNQPPNSNFFPPPLPQLQPQQQLISNIITPRPLYKFHYQQNPTDDPTMISSPALYSPQNITQTNNHQNSTSNQQLNESSSSQQ